MHFSKAFILTAIFASAGSLAQDLPSFSEPDSSGRQSVSRPNLGRQTGARTSLGRETSSRPSVGRETGDPPSAGRETGAAPSVGRESGLPSAGRQTGTPPSVGRETGLPSAGRQTGAPPSFPIGTGGASVGVGSAPLSKSCPPVWKLISKDLTSLFVSGGQCNDDARSIIRAIFHDCFPSGGCDGSLALPGELSRDENAPMAPAVNKLSALARKYSVPVADVIVFASSHAVADCPGGPIVQTFIGRKDAKSPTPPNQLPAPNATAADSISKFASRGLSVADLGALIGAHTASRQFTTDLKKVGAPEDTTPGIWDTLYFSQTLAGSAPFIIPADLNLRNSPQVGPFYKKFAANKGSWDSAFAPALMKLQALGSSSAKIDCTEALPQGQQKRRRSSHAAMVARAF